MLVQRCFFGHAPTLLTADNAFGEGTAEEWLTLQLTDLSEMSGAGHKLTIYQIRQLATLIRSEYYYLKVTELEVFFRRFKIGRYGEFYGSVDPIVINKSLRQFLRERGEMIYEHDMELERQKREQWQNSPTRMTYDEYREWKKNRNRLEE